MKYLLSRQITQINNII